MKAKLIFRIYDTESVDAISLGNEVSDDKIINKSHQFIVAPSGYVASLEVRDEGGNIIYEEEEYEMVPRYAVATLSEALKNQNVDDLDEEEFNELKSYVDGLKFSSSAPKVYSAEWERMKTEDEGENSFIINLLRGSIKDKKECFAEAGDCGDYSSLYLEYEIDLENNEFDPDILDYFNVDPDPEENSEIWKVFSKDSIFLDAIIYSKVLYGLSSNCEEIEPNAWIEKIDTETLDSID